MVLLLMLPASAATLHVDGVEFGSLEDAVDVAVDGDTIEIAAGTWPANVIVTDDIDLVGLPGAVLAGDATSSFALEVRDATVSISDLRIQGDDEVPVKIGDFWQTPGNVSHGIRTGDVGALVVDIFSPPRAEYRQTGAGFGADAE